MAFNLLDLLLPRETKFYTYFEELVDALVDGCKVFQGVMTNIEDMTEAKIHEQLVLVEKFEIKGDEIERKIIDEMNKTFITPLDREDIHLMAINMNKSLDILNSISRKIKVYNIRKMSRNVVSFCDIIVEITGELRQLISLLQKKQSVLEHVEKMHALENRADDLFLHSMADLFSGTYEALDVIKYKELFEHLESVVDSVDYIGKLVRGIIVKQG